jgi:hypothetical protein
MLTSVAKMLTGLLVSVVGECVCALGKVQMAALGVLQGLALERKVPNTRSRLKLRR